MDDDFFSVIAAGYGNGDGHQGELVFVDMVGGREFDIGVRVAALATRLSAGDEWEAAGEQAGFALCMRDRSDRRPGVGIELDDGRLLRLDVFEFARDPLRTAFRMLADPDPDPRA